MNREWGAVKPAIALTLMVGMLTSCGGSGTTTGPANPPATSSPTVQGPKVVATTTILCDMAKTIAANTIDLTCLLKPGVDGHVYAPLPADRKAIEAAQLILYSGYDFESELIKLIQSTSNPAPKVAVGELAVPKPLTGDKHEHGQAEDVDHAEEKADNVPDPHVWQRADNGARMVDVIQQNLTKLNPEQSTLYTQNAQTLETKLTQIHTWIKSQVATIPERSRKLVTTHEALGYYAAAYNIPIEGALQGISTEVKPTAARVKELVDEVKRSGVPAIFAEVAVNPKLIEAVAKDAQVTIANPKLFADSLGEPGSVADTYPNLLLANTQTIVENLGGKLTPFPAQ
jgi:manganese/iron transport system substrate-binding protein